MEAAFQKALQRPREQLTYLRDEQQAWVEERNACEGDIGCLMSSYQDRLRAISGNPSKPKLYYGSRAGMYASILTKSGVGTRNATMKIRLTDKDAKDYCVDYGRNYSAACVKKTREDWGLASEVAANCKLGTWTDLFGDRHKFSEFGPIETSGPEASAQANILAVFYELCPKYRP